MNKKDEKLAYKVSIVSIIANIFLTIVKLISGIFAHSSAMVSDAVHSLSDVLSTFVVMIGIKISSKKADEAHPYGHERLECVAALVLAVMLFTTGLGIGYAAIIKIINKEAIVMPGVIALAAAVLSIIVKEAMYWYTRGAAKKINSGALLADAWHHRSDALSSVGSFIGILGSRMGLKILDPIASVIICLFIIKVAYEIFKDSVDKMVDKSCDEKTLNKIIKIIESNKKVLNIDDIKTRQFGNKVYVDIEIAVDENMILKDAHKVAEDVHDEIENKIRIVKHCMVHVNPIVVKNEK